MSMSMRVLAVDDEPLALQRLEWCLRDLPEVELVGKARDGRRALELIRSLSPDVVLLDIEMPELNGFELIDALGDEELPQVVFVTAFDHFAVQAFATGSVDYLLKPVEQERLRMALDRARTRIELHDAQMRVGELKTLVNTLRQGRRAALETRYENELWVREGDSRVRIPVNLVERIEADGDYVRLHVGSACGCCAPSSEHSPSSSIRGCSCACTVRRSYGMTWSPRYAGRTPGARSR